MFSLETPSRVMRRIQDLEDLQDDLPDLPDLPDSFQDSNDSIQLEPEPETTLVREETTPYTSTPAPASSQTYFCSQSTIVPSTASSVPLSNASRRELPSFDADASAIGRAHSLDEDREDMLVMSGSGSGEESERPPPRASEEEHDSEGDRSSAAARALDAFFDNDDDLPAAPPDPHDYSRPLAGEDGRTVPSSERARRLSAASAAAHISIRRPTLRRKSTATALPLPLSPSPPPELPSDSDDAPPAPDASAKLDARPFSSPLRELSNTQQQQGHDSTYGSPGVGRHASPQPSPHASEIQHPYTPASQRATTPSSSSLSQLSPFYTTPSIDPTRSDADRRKAHVLSTLRSTAKPHFLSRPTPHKPSPLSATPADPTAGSDDGESIGSSNDLTTFHKGNTSLPSGGVAEKSTRFNGAKLNAYLHSLNTHLTEENQSLVQMLGETNREVKRLTKEWGRLEDRVREMSVVGGSSGVGSEAEERGEKEEEESRVERLERQLEGLVESHEGINGLKRQLGDELAAGVDDDGRVAGLEAQVERMEQALKDKDAELELLKAAPAPSEAQADAAAKEIEGLHARADELLSELEDKDGEVEAARRELEEQEADFADKMQRLEEELSRVMGEQEQQLARAREDLDKRRREDDDAKRDEAAKLDEARRSAEELRVALDEVKDERDRLERQVASAGSAAAKEASERVRQLRDQVASLTSTITTKDAEIQELQAGMEEFESKVDELDADDSELKRAYAAQAENLKQMEEALDESARQLLQNEEEMDGLRVALASERSVVASLSAQISQLSLHKTKAKSPLANEAYNDGKDSAVATLEDELDEARSEIDQLKARLAAAERARIEIKDLEVKTLESHKLDLEERVTSLRHQVQSTPSRTPDKSMLFRSIIGVQTPKTPGHFMSNLSAWSPGTNAGDTTISPLLAQIQELELIVERLQAQLASANDDIDTKLDKLEAAGSSTIALARQLAQARERIAQLEADLDRLLGDHGTLHRVQTRLTTINCPDCHHTFDANKSVQMLIDRASHSVSIAESESAKGPKVTQSLREALAGVNAKVSELKTENSVLQDVVARSKGLAAEKSALTRQHAALQKDFDSARIEIAGLEGELNSERDRVRTLTSEASLTSRARSSLESRLSTTESELRNVTRNLAGTAGPQAQQLRREKAGLVRSRADLVQQLASVNEHVSRPDKELASTKAAQADLESELTRHVAEIGRCRDAIQTKDAAHRVLADERADILRGVAGLQADLNRVRQETVSLGLDLAAVRRERDLMGEGKSPGEDAEFARLQDELVKAKRRLGVFELKVAEHVCPSDANALVEMKARHSDEAKGLLVMIRYLKIRVTREATFRNDLSYQKGYLSAIVRQKQSSIDSTLSTLVQFGMPYHPPTPQKAKVSFRGVAKAVVAVARMNILAKRWKSQSAPKTKLRTQAYLDTRGRPFVA